MPVNEYNEGYFLLPHDYTPDDVVGSAISAAEFHQKIDAIRQRAAIRLQLPESPSERIDAATLATVRRAVTRRQELQFEYLSSFQADTPRRHRVAPYLVFFRPEGPRLPRRDGLGGDASGQRDHSFGHPLPA